MIMKLILLVFFNGDKCVVVFFIVIGWIFVNILSFFFNVNNFFLGFFFVLFYFGLFIVLSKIVLFVK